jgi:hypothetical protein
LIRRSKAFRERLRQSFYPYYISTAPLRPLPNAVILGGMKCGTTSLNAWLREHPDVAFSSVKETHYFDKHYQRGLRWYQTHFPLWERWQGAHCTLEATPAYLYRADRVAARMHAQIPEARLVVMLRDPVKRAISHYRHLRRNGKEHRAPELALLSDFASNGRRENPYKSRGLYAKQIKEFLHFYNRSQLLILKSEEFFARPAATYEQVQRFLGLNLMPLPTGSEARNVSSKQQPIPQDVSDHLAHFYQQPNHELSLLLPDFSGW